MTNGSLLCGVVAALSSLELAEFRNIYGLLGYVLVGSSAFMSAEDSGDTDVVLISSVAQSTATKPLRALCTALQTHPSLSACSLYVVQAAVCILKVQFSDESLDILWLGECSVPAFEDDPFVDEERATVPVFLATARNRIPDAVAIVIRTGRSTFPPTKPPLSRVLACLDGRSAVTDCIHLTKVILSGPNLGVGTVSDDAGNIANLHGRQSRATATLGEGPAPVRYDVRISRWIGVDVHVPRLLSVVGCERRERSRRRAGADTVFGYAGPVAVAGALQSREYEKYYGEKRPGGHGVGGFRRTAPVLLVRCGLAVW